MPLATVTGNLNDMMGQAFPLLNPKIIFKPSGPGLSGTKIFASKRIVKVVPHAEGYFTVDLQVTTEMRPVVHYQVSIQWATEGGDFQEFDHPDWKLFVPEEGGLITDLFVTPVNPFMFWVDADPPPYPLPGQYWLNTTTGDLTKWTV